MGSVNHAIAIAEQAVYETPVTPDRWLDFVSESMKMVPGNLMSESQRPGRRVPAARQAVRSTEHAEGNLELEVATSNFGMLWKHMLGDSTPVVTPEGDGFKHTFVLGDMQRSLTIHKQVQREDDPAEIEPFTYVGAKCTDWRLSIAANQLARVSIGWNARQELNRTLDGVALETAAYPPPPTNLSFAEASFLKGGVSLARVTTAEITARNNLETGVYHLGAGGLQGEPRNRFGDEFGGTVNVDWGAPSELYEAFREYETLELALRFEGRTFDDGLPGEWTEGLDVLLHAVKLAGDSPQIPAGGSRVNVPYPFNAYTDDNGDVITVEYTTAEDEITP